MIWFFGILFALVGLIMMIPNAILGGIILFVLCVMGIASGVWYFVIPSVLLLIGLMINIFGDA